MSEENASYTIEAIEETRTFQFTRGEGAKHRAFGPAIEREDGHTEYWYFDELHNAHGPAVIHSRESNKRDQYFIEGEKVLKKDFEKARKEYFKRTGRGW